MAQAKRKLLVEDLTEEDKQAYLELVSLGYRPAEAANEIGTTGHQFRKLRSPKSHWYDPEFAEAFAVALETHDSHYLERLRDVRAQMIFEDKNPRMVEKESLLKDPEWEPLRHTNFRHEIDVLIRRLPELGLTRDQIDKAIAAEEARLGTPPELKALPMPADVESA